MWTCDHCGERIENQFDTCWKCSTPRTAQSVSPSPGKTPSASEPSVKWFMAFRVFRGTFTSWENLFSEAADFASEIGPERVVSISHSEDRSDGVVTVWYWSNSEEAREG